MEIKWLGWAAFELTSERGLKILVDPVLHYGPVKVEDIKRVDYMIITHCTGDHAGPFIQIAKNTQPKAIFGDHATRVHAARNGIDPDKFISPCPGMYYEFEGLKFKATESVHANVFMSVKGDPLPGKLGGPGELMTGFPFSMIVYDESNVSVWIPGDTAIGYHIKLIGELYRPNIALLHVGNPPPYSAEFSPREAALALQWLGSDIGIPMHYDPYDEDMNMKCEKFIEYAKILAPWAKIVKMKPGEVFKYTK